MQNRPGYGYNGSERAVVSIPKTGRFGANRRNLSLNGAKKGRRGGKGRGGITLTNVSKVQYSHMNQFEMLKRELKLEKEIESEKEIWERKVKRRVDGGGGYMGNMEYKGNLEHKGNLGYKGNKEHKGKSENFGFKGNLIKGNYLDPGYKEIAKKTRKRDKILNLTNAGDIRFLTYDGRATPKISSGGPVKGPPSKKKKPIFVERNLGDWEVPEDQNRLRTPKGFFSVPTTQHLEDTGQDFFGKIDIVENLKSVAFPFKHKGNFGGVKEVDFLDSQRKKSPDLPMSDQSESPQMLRGLNDGDGLMWNLETPPNRGTKDKPIFRELFKAKNNFGNFENHKGENFENYRGENYKGKNHKGKRVNKWKRKKAENILTERGTRSSSAKPMVGILRTKDKKRSKTKVRREVKFNSKVETSDLKKVKLKGTDGHKLATKKR